MEVDPLFIGPAALAKAYRFVGDPRDGQQYERLKDLSEDPHGIYDCTHCFNCIEACPKGVAPMSQIMRLRRIAGGDHEIEDRNNGLPAREGVRQEHRAQRPAARGRPAARLLRRQVPPARGARAARLAARHPQGAAARQGDAEEGAAALAQGGRRTSSASSSRSTRRTSATSSTSTSWATRTTSEEAQAREGRLLARLREPRLHARAARLDGAGRPAARHRAGRARPRLLHRRRRDRRAQPGAGRHPQRPHLRARPAGRGRGHDDEHLLDLPGRAERVPGAARRQQRVPRARQPDAGEREPALREGHRQQALPVADGRGDRARRAALEGAAAADRPARRARSTAATSCARPTGSASTASTRATATCTR